MKNWVDTGEGRARKSVHCQCAGMSVSVGHVLWECPAKSLKSAVFLLRIPHLSAILCTIHIQELSSIYADNNITSCDCHVTRMATI